MPIHNVNGRSHAFLMRFPIPRSTPLPRSPRAEPTPSFVLAPAETPSLAASSTADASSVGRPILSSASRDSDLSAQSLDLRPGKVIGVGDVGTGRGEGRVDTETVTSMIGGRAATVVDAMRFEGRRKEAPRARGRAVRARK